MGRDFGELLACVGPNGALYPLERKKAHEKGIHHLVVRVFAFTREGEFLVQNRAADRGTYPGCYTDSASGHVPFSFGLLFDREKALLSEALRELREEVGVSVLMRDSPLMKAFGEPYYSEEAFETSHCFVAAVERDLRPGDEVDPGRTRFVARRTLRRMLRQNRFVPEARMIWRVLLDHLGRRDAMAALF